MEETILIVGDTNEEEIFNSATLLKTFLPRYHIEAVSLQQCLSRATAKDSYCMTVVLNLPSSQHGQALHTIMNLQKADPQLPVVVWVQYGEEAFAKDAIKAGTYDFITRPIAAEKLVLSLQHACDVRRMRGYVARLEQHIAEQTDISPMERDAIMIQQMHQLLVDEHGQIKPLKSMEKEIIVAVLGYSNGCVSRAARSLGIGRSTLYRKVNEYDIQGYIKREAHITRPPISTPASGRVSGT